MPGNLEPATAVIPFGGTRPESANGVACESSRITPLAASVRATDRHGRRDLLNHCVTEPRTG
jgi:hypothetical protein